MTRDAPTRRRSAQESPAPPGARAAPTALTLHRRGRPTGLVALDPTTSWTVGRGASADLCFDDDAVSRVHAHLKVEQGALLLVDARSANGTFVVDALDRLHDDVATDAGRRALFARARLVVPGEPVPLCAGDVVFLGDAHAALEAQHSDAVAARAVDAPALAELSLSSSGPGSRSAAGQRFEHNLRRAARAQGPVLLIGPSGSGKTWAARTIHDDSGRRGRFVALNAAALPRDPAPLRSVLLGHKKGAFTGATHDVMGAWPAADGGTLFLDEVDSLHPEGQAFLLTLLEQSGDMGALGDGAWARVSARDVRVVAASKISLQQASLRADLAWRLVDGTIIEAPALSERREDIPAILGALLAELRREDGVVAPFDDEAIAVAADAEWPGQVRQLRSVVRVLAREALAEHRAAVSGSDVRARIAALARAVGDEGSASSSVSFAPRAAPAPAPAEAAPRAPTSSPPPLLQPPQRKKARALTPDDVRDALAAEGGNIQRAAERLDVARNTLISKMDAFGIPRPGRGSSG